jgi:hypothetical protein
LLAMMIRAPTSAAIRMARGSSHLSCRIGIGSSRGGFAQSLQAYNKVRGRQAGKPAWSSHPGCTAQLTSSLLQRRITSAVAIRLDKCTPVVASSFKTGRRISIAGSRGARVRGRGGE